MKETIIASLSHSAESPVSQLLSTEMSSDAGLVVMETQLMLGAYGLEPLCLCIPSEGKELIPENSMTIMFCVICRACRTKGETSSLWRRQAWECWEKEGLRKADSFVNSSRVRSTGFKYVQIDVGRLGEGCGGGRSTGTQ